MQQPGSAICATESPAVHSDVERHASLQAKRVKCPNGPSNYGAANAPADDPAHNALLSFSLGAVALSGCGSSSDVVIGRSNNEETSTNPAATEVDTTEAATSNVETTDVDTTEVETTVAGTVAETDPTIPFATEVVNQVVCPKEDGSSSPVAQFPAPPQTCIDPSHTYTATLTTNIGLMTLLLDPAAARLTVNNFVFLADYHYYDGTTCHRIIPGFVVQCGDPTATGTGGPGYEFPDELPRAGPYQIGSLAMANAGPDTNGSQFFTVTGEQGAALQPDYALFGQVTAGLDVLAAIDALGSDSGDPISPVDIESITITVG